MRGMKPTRLVVRLLRKGQLGLFDQPVTVHSHQMVTHAGQAVQVQEYQSHRRKKPEEQEAEKRPLLAWKQPDAKPTMDDLHELLAKLGGHADPALVEKLKATLAEHKPTVEQPPQPIAPQQATKVKAGEAHESPHDLDRVGNLVGEFRGLLKHGQVPTDPKSLREYAGRIFPEHGDPSEYTDDLYDSLEGALARHHSESSSKAATDSIGDRLERAERHESMLARRNRSLGLSDLQQFSTPLTISEAVQIAASPRPGDTVLEPTAGTGNLIGTLAAHHDGPIIANELSDRRASVLKASQWPDNVKIEQGDYLWRKGKADVVVANPPWGSYKTGHYGRATPVAGFTPNDVAERFVVKMMADLNDGGRLVAVMPTTILGPGGYAFRKWLAGTNTVRAMIEMPGDWYSRRGTNIGSVLLVVDKGQQGDLPVPIAKTLPHDERGRSVGTYPISELAQLLQPLTAGGTHARYPEGEKHGDATDPGSAEFGQVGELEDAAAAGTGAAVQGTQPRRTRRTRRPDAGGAGVRDEPAGMAAPVVAAQPGDRPAEHPADAERAEPVVARLSEGDAALRLKHAEAASHSPIFAEFVRPYRLARGIPHPRLVVESRNLSVVPYPELTYKVDESLINANRLGRISNEGLSAVAAMRQANENGHAMMLADATGLGKSRIGGGWVLDLLKQRNPDGSLKHRKVFVVTKSFPNIEDLQDEFREVASGASDPDKGAHFPARFINVSEYSDATDLRQSKEPEQWTPLPQPGKDDQIVYFLEAATGPARFSKAIEQLDPDAALLDEAHEFKNVDDKVQKGIWWGKFHEQLKARQAPIAYMTATPGTSVEELKYLYGLGEWSTDGFERWVNRITGRSDEDPLAKPEPPPGEEEGGLTGEKSYVEAGGGKSKTKGKRKESSATDAFNARFSPAEQEQIMRELKMKGKFMSRDLWREFTFDAHEDPFTEEERGTFDKIAPLLHDIRTVHASFANQNEVDQKRSPTSNLQFATKRILAHFRLQRAVKMAKESIAKGKQPVIFVEYVSETKPDEGNVLAAIQSINTWKKEQARDEDGKPIAGKTDFEEHIPEAVKAQAELVERARKIIPTLDDPIAYVQRELGQKNVISITGKTKKNERSALRNRFQKGDAKAALVSGAGQTGISLHDVNSSQRHAIMADYPWSAMRAMQAFGRVDRTGQKSAAEITMLHQGTPAEQKFIATLAARVKSLGATSKGQAESTRTDALDDFEFNTSFDKLGLREAWSAMGKEYADKLEKHGDAINDRALFLAGGNTRFDVAPRDVKRHIEQHHRDQARKEIIGEDPREWFLHKNFRDKAGSGKVANDITGDVKRFLMELQWMPLKDSEYAMAKFLEHRETVLDREGGGFNARTQSTGAKMLRSTDLKREATDLVPLQLHEYEYKEANPRNWLKAHQLPEELSQKLARGTDTEGVWHRDDVHDMAMQAARMEGGVGEALTKKRYDKPTPITIRKGLLTGMITPEMTKLRHYLDKAGEGKNAAARRIYSRVKDDATGQEHVGMEIPWKSIQGVRDLYGKLTSRRPEDVLPDLKLGMKIPLADAQWHLHLGTGGTREGRIVIHGTRKTEADTLTRWGAEHSPVGDYFWLPEEKLPAFVKEFGLADKPVDKTTDRLSDQIKTGKPLRLDNGWSVETTPDRNIVKIKGLGQHSDELKKYGAWYSYKTYAWHLPVGNLDQLQDDLQAQDDSGQDTVEKSFRPTRLVVRRRVAV